MKQQELAEQIAEKHLGKVSWKLYGERQKQQILAAIVEAMDAPAKEGMKWVKASERLPEIPEKWYWCKIARLDFKGAFYFNNGWFSSLIDTVYENNEVEWLDEPAKEAISVPAQQPSLEEKKEDLVASDNNSSPVPCDAPFINNNSIEQ
jgi:hypothetical protein